MYIYICVGVCMKKLSGIENLCSVGEQGRFFLVVTYVIYKYPHITTCPNIKFS